MIGDFNIVEDPIDRAPTHLDKEDAISALCNLQETHNMQDTWHHTFPTECAFTFCTHTETQSRLDHIYALLSHQKNLFQWNMGLSGVPMDHDLITIYFSPNDALQIGPGCWTWPLYLINKTELINEVIKSGKKLEATL